LADYFADDSDTGNPMEVVTIYKTKPTLGFAIEGGANTKKPLPRVLNIQVGSAIVYVNLQLPMVGQYTCSIFLIKTE